MIAEELDLERKCRDGQAERVYYELTEMCSVELERFNAKKAQEEVGESFEIIRISTPHFTVFFLGN